VDINPDNYSSITHNVFEHLIELDKDGQWVPRLATGWQWRDDHTLDVTLRQGVTFHNGEVFDAEIVQLNFDENTRLHQPQRIGTFLNFPPGSRLGSAPHVMLALHRSSRQVVVTDEEFDSTDMMGELLGKRQRVAHQP
jgi:ABC-type transport system substrate-binding protein